MDHAVVKPNFEAQMHPAFCDHPARAVNRGSHRLLMELLALVYLSVAI